MSVIAHQLAVSIAWCRNRSPLGASLPPGGYRSNALAGVARSVFPDSCHTEYSPVLSISFEAFAAERERLTEPPLPNPQSELERKQALLLVNWRKSLFDGAVVPETGGFIDENYIPAWDTWLAIVPIDTDFGTHGLLSWIPKSLTNHVDMAIQVDPASCLAWCELQGAMLECREWGRGFLQSE